MQVRLCWCLVDSENGIDDIRSKFVGKRSIEFCGERCPCNRQKKFSVNLPLDLERIKKLCEYC